ncbi:hypothetical protein H3221_016500 [Pseudomonas sp. LMG 31766]|uniref:Uncharacterized protein n=1 Tax=Pseudomonas chaetocerotis TaxID=2758695 RepID=A0A931D467_9PSED|nr:hypothetical protein [Pseudomonas chaetocerotis]MBZ9666345.1 hypothetical protein [Pseudomonas chaetocerotis]
MNHARKNQPLVLPDDLAEAQLLMERLSADCTRVRGQIDAAKAERQATGRYADPNWFHRVSTALRWMNRDRQRLQDHIAALRRRAGAGHDQALIKRLRVLVGEEAFEACRQLAAHDEVGGHG